MQFDLEIKGSFEIADADLAGLYERDTGGRCAEQIAILPLTKLVGLIKDDHQVKVEWGAEGSP